MKCLIFLSLVYSIHAIVYDRYEGTLITEEQQQRYAKANSTSTCTIDINPCEPNEGRRLDGSCTNPRNPTIGAVRMPYLRLLDAKYGENYEPMKSVSGKALPSTRTISTHILKVGSVPSQEFTQLLTNFMTMSSSNVISQHDTINYLQEKTHCCTEEGKSDPECIPTMVPKDDFIHRFSGITCLNLTRPKTFQSLGCTAKDTTPSRIVLNTPAFDLSTIYGNSDETLRKYRTLENGMLKYDVDENGIIWPPNSTAETNGCKLNQKPTESRCHDTPNTAMNSLMPLNLISIFHWRRHNQLALRLSKINPCWSDQKLFDTARAINIAEHLQIAIYEMWKVVLGEENLIRDGVISTSHGFRDIYDESIDLQLSLEFPYMLRYFHTVQEGHHKMYDTNGTYIDKMPIGNLTFRTGFLAKGDNMKHMTQGLIKQPCGGFDYTVDPIVSNMALGSNQLVTDLMSNDAVKGRYFGFPPYIDYIKFWYGKSVTCWEDLYEYIAQERVELLKDVYEDVGDVDLMAGTWLEKPVTGGKVPSMVYKVMVEQLLRHIKADPLWYERKGFTYSQLLQLRKTSISAFLCEVGDSVTKIQRHGFLRISPENPLVDCSEIPKIDISAWEDRNCQQQKESE